MKKWLAVLIALALLAVPVTAFAWNGGLNVARDCNGVTVTANPENPYWEDRSGLEQTKWVVTNITGAGFFPWGANTSLSGTVNVTWQKYKSYTGGLLWHAAIPSQFHSESYGWSKNKPNNCLIPVAASVTFQEPTCDFPNAGWTTYDTDKVNYVKTGSAVPGGSITVTATAKAGYVLTGQTVFTHTYVTLESLGCYQTCDAVVDGAAGQWSEWELNQAGDGYTRTRTVPLLDSVDLVTVCDVRTETETKEAEFSDDFSAIQDCAGVVVTKHFYRDGIEYKDPVDVETHLWANPYKPESFQSEFFRGPFVKDLSCLECKVTPLYPQAAYLDPNAPETYWQGPFGMGPGVAVVIHPDGQVPSADRVTTVASLCPEQFDGGYIYHGERMFLDGWVYRIDCYGQEPHYTYMGYNWDEYVRLGMYDETGVRICAREPGCADWISENK